MRNILSKHGARSFFCFANSSLPPCVALCMVSLELQFEQCLNTGETEHAEYKVQNVLVLVFLLQFNFFHVQCNLPP